MNKSSKAACTALLMALTTTATMAAPPLCLIYEFGELNIMSDDELSALWLSNFKKTSEFGITAGSREVANCSTQSDRILRIQKSRKNAAVTPETTSPAKQNITDQRKQ